MSFKPQLTKLDQIKLSNYVRELGPVKNSEEALAIALEYDEINRTLAPWDIAKSRFVELVRVFTEYAVLLEKQENDQKNQKVTPC